MKQQTFNHLVNNIPNNPINRAIISQLNRMMAKSNSCHRLRIRYRTPKTPAGRHQAITFYGHPMQKASVNRDDAKTFAVYLERIDQVALRHELDEQRSWTYWLGYRRACTDHTS